MKYCALRICASIYLCELVAELAYQYTSLGWPSSRVGKAAATASTVQREGMQKSIRCSQEYCHHLRLSTLSSLPFLETSAKPNREGSGRSLVLESHLTCHATSFSPSPQTNIITFQHWTLNTFHKVDFKSQDARRDSCLRASQTRSKGLRRRMSSTHRCSPLPIG